MLSFPSICKIFLLLMLAASSCTTTEGSSGSEDENQGSISYPFVSSQAQPLGGANHFKDHKLVIKTAVGNTEYQLEVPEAIDDMDVEIPIAPLHGSQVSGPLAGDHPSGLSNPSSADRELVSALPNVQDKYPSETGVLDKAFGTGPNGGYRQSPSYVLGIAKVNQHYRRREYEYAMVEINNLLAFYPNSPKLHKMKGTVLARMGSLELAERAWLRAQQLEPDDAGLNNGIRQLQQRIALLKRPVGPITGTIAPIGEPVVAPPPPQSQASAPTDSQLQPAPAARQSKATPAKRAAPPSTAASQPRRLPSPLAPQANTNAPSRSAAKSKAKKRERNDNLNSLELNN